MIRTNSIFLVGPLPPPVHGMALVTATIRDRLAALGAQAITVDLAADSLDRALNARFARIRKVLSGLVRFIFSAPFKPGAVIYIAISGGWGQIYDLVFVSLARLFRMQIYLHHHNIVYMTTCKRLTHWLARAAGPCATHIVASEKIGQDFKARYPISKLFVLSAVVATSVPPEEVLRERKKVKTIGFIGNVSEDKGIFDFLRLAEVLQERGSFITALVAGPFQGKEVEAEVRKRLRNLPHVHYVGPKYGKEKAKFYCSIDVLLFPVREEYEGIVVHEAMSFGVPVLARNSGCIAEIIDPKAVIEPDADFTDEAWRRLSEWQEVPRNMQSASCAARRGFTMYRSKNIKSLDQLCFEMLGQPQDDKEMESKHD